MPTGASTPALPTPFSAPAQSAPAAQSDAPAEPLRRADSMERACYYALKGGLYELKGATKHKLPIKAGWAATSAVQGFRKGMAEPPPPPTAGDLVPPALHRLRHGEAPQRSSSGRLSSLLRTGSGASSGVPRSESSTSVNTLLRAASGHGGLAHSGSSGNLGGLPHSASSGDLRGLRPSGSSGDLRGVRYSASGGNLSGLHHSGSSGDLRGIRYSASGGNLSDLSSGQPYPQAPALGAVCETEGGEQHYGKARRRSLERHDRSHPYAARAHLPAHACIAPYHSAQLRAPEQPATYRLHVSLACIDAEAAFATKLAVTPEAPQWVNADVRRLPATLQAAPYGDITLHNPSSAHVVARIGEALPPPLPLPSSPLL